MALSCLLFGWQASAREPAQKLFFAGGQVGLRALSDGAVVAWSAEARLRFHSATVRGRSDGWSDATDFGPGRIRDVVSDVAGVLVLVERPGEAGQLSEEVLLLDSHGRSKDEWKTEGLVWSVASGGGRRWATMLPKGAGLPRRHTDQLLSLEPGGAIRLVDDVPHRTHVVSFSAGASGNARLDCTEKDATKAGARLPFCRVAERGGWMEHGLWDDAPIACGAYSIEILDEGAGVNPFPKDSRPQVAVRRLLDGRVMTTARLDPGSIVSCAAPDRLLVGRDDVRALSLPALKALWRLPSADGRVVAMAASGPGAWIATASEHVRLIAPGPSARASAPSR